MSTTLLGQAEVTLDRNDLWDLKANPYETAENVAKLRSIGVDPVQFEEFAKKLGRCTNRIHIRQILYLVAMMVIAPIIVLIMIFLRQIKDPFPAFLIITALTELIFLCILPVFYFRYQPIMHKRAQYLVEEENLKSANTGVEYRIASCGFSLTVIKKGNSTGLNINDNSLLVDIYNFPLIYNKNDRYSLDIPYPEELMTFVNLRNNEDVKFVYMDLISKNREIQMKHVNVCIIILIVLLFTAILTVSILGIVFGAFDGIIWMLVCGCLGLVFGFVIFIGYLVRCQMKFLAEYREYIEKKNEGEFKKRGFFVDARRAHYLLGVFVFNTNYQPSGGSYRSDPNTARYFN